MDLGYCNILINMLFCHRDRGKDRLLTYMSRPRYSPEANKRALDYIQQYTKENYDRITILRTKGERERLKALASRKGISVNEMINSLIDKYLPD